MADKIYVGFGKMFGEYGSIKLSININDRDGNRIITPKKGGWINLVVNKRKEPDQKGNEYSVQLDTFEPKQRIEPIQQEDLPF
jgi:hypothetical protein